MIKRILVPLLLLFLFGFKIPGRYAGIGNYDYKTEVGAPYSYDQPEQFDGPYVLYKNDKVFVKYIVQSNGVRMVQADSMFLSEKKNVTLKVNTDDPGRKFIVHLKDQLENEKTEYKKVSRQFVLSDIEGNFGAFRKLLQ